MEAFSDGVFAIAITLLVLEIGVPQGSGGDLLGALRDQWPSYLGYLVSFATIGAVWFAHSVITECLDYANATLVRINLLVLMVVSFLPFPTRLLADYVESSGAERVAATLYGVNLFLASALVSVLWRYGVREGLIRTDLEDREIDALTSRLTPGAVAYVAIIVVGLFFPIVAVVGYFLVALFILLPIRGLRRH